jgi:hypothetical protein
MAKVYCKNCQCWDNSDDPNAKTSAEGFCHFFSPQGHPAYFLACWPKTMGDFYCFQGIEKGTE